MQIYPEGSPERDDELERAAEARRMRAELRASIDWAEEDRRDEFDRIGAFHEILARPIDLTAPEYRECPECGERGKHVCRAKE